MRHRYGRGRHHGWKRWAKNRPCPHPAMPQCWPLFVPDPWIVGWSLEQLRSIVTIHLLCPRHSIGHKGPNHLKNLSATFARQCLGRHPMMDELSACSTIQLSRDTFNARGPVSDDSLCHYKITASLIWRLFCLSCIAAFGATKLGRNVHISVKISKKRIFYEDYVLSAWIFIQNPRRISPAGSLRACAIALAFIAC